MPAINILAKIPVKTDSYEEYSVFEYYISFIGRPQYITFMDINMSNDLELSILLFGSFFFTGFLAWLIFKHRNHRSPVTLPQKGILKKPKISPEIAPAPKISVFEKFDYLGTKIFHNDGKYTVVEDGVSRNFNSLNELPSRYRKMILEMETQNFSGRKDNYYMETKDGAYIIVFPDGTRKKYKNYSDIPDKIKKILTGK